MQQTPRRWRLSASTPSSHATRSHKELSLTQRWARCFLSPSPCIPLFLFSLPLPVPLSPFSLSLSLCYCLLLCLPLPLSFSFKAPQKKCQGKRGRHGSLVSQSNRTACVHDVSRVSCALAGRGEPDLRVVTAMAPADCNGQGACSCNGSSQAFEVIRRRSGRAGVDKQGSCQGRREP